MPKDTKSSGYNKAPACESRGFGHKKEGENFDTPSLRTIITPLILSLLYQKTNLNKKNISNRFVLDLKVNINRNGI